MDSAMAAPKMEAGRSMAEALTHAAISRSIPFHQRLVETKGIRGIG